MTNFRVIQNKCKFLMELDLFFLIDYKIFLDFILNTKQQFDIELFGITVTPLRMTLYYTSHSKQTLWPEGEKKLSEFLLVFASLF